MLHRRGMSAGAPSGNGGRLFSLACCLVLAPVGVASRPALPAQAAARSVTSGLPSAGGHFTSVSAGLDTACGVEGRGSLVCWGSDESKEAEPPAGDFTSVAAGESEACGIRARGSVTCWGADRLAPRGSFAQVSEGYVTACGVRGRDGGPGPAVCWWAAAHRLHTRTHPGHFVEVSAGLGVGPACGVERGGSLSCWRYRPLASQAPRGTFAQVSVGGNADYRLAEFACAIRLSHTAVCWGNNPSGQTNAPGGTFTQVSAGGTFACGIRTGGTAVCWGDAPPAPKGILTEITSGDHFVCGLRVGGGVTCTGDNRYGQTESPGVRFAQISVGGLTVCGVRTNRSLTCWGDNTPVPAGRFTQVSVGCAIRVNRSIVCWPPGQAPKPPSGAFTQVDAGKCAVRTDGSLACWGGVGVSGMWEGTRVKIPTGRFSRVSVGWGGMGDFACAIRLSGPLVCWGDPTGPRGVIGSQTDPPAGRFTEVAAAAYGACAVRGDGAIICWGGSQQSVRFTSWRYLEVGAGFSEGGVVCGLRVDHRIICAAKGPWSVGRYLQVSTGVGDTTDPGNVCGLEANGGVKCWGSPSVVVPAATSGG